MKEIPVQVNSTQKSIEFPVENSDRVGPFEVVQSDSVDFQKSPFSFKSNNGGGNENPQIHDEYGESE